MGPCAPTVRAQVDGAIGLPGFGMGSPAQAWDSQSLEFPLLYLHSISSPRVTDISFFKMTRLRFLTESGIRLPGMGVGKEEDVFPQVSVCS